MTLFYIYLIFTDMNKQVFRHKVCQVSDIQLITLLSLGELDPDLSVRHRDEPGADPHLPLPHILQLVSLHHLHLNISNYIKYFYNILNIFTMRV